MLLTAAAVVDLTVPYAVALAVLLLALGIVIGYTWANFIRRRRALRHFLEAAAAESEANARRDIPHRVS